MADTLLESSALSAFCGSIATMISAGIQTDEAVHMLAENREESRFKSVCSQIYSKLIQGSSLADSMEATGAFPKYAQDLVDSGERSGRLEKVLRSLDLYYDEEDRMFAKIRSSVGYPSALLCIMSVILAFTVVVILPVFVNVYENMSGSLTAGSFGSVGVSIVIGWIALVVTLLCTVVVLAAALLARNESGRQRLLRVFERLGLTKQATYQLALSRFTTALATYVSSGINNEDAMRKATDTVDHAELRAKLEKAYASMVDLNNPRSLSQAISENDIFEPLYARLLEVGARSGSVDQVLTRLSETFFEDAVAKIDQVVDRIEPILAAFLTIAVGATLIAVMLPLIGIMKSIG
ncbi:MAG: type II secretion system F family protein [Atopobiaceae bacterium]|jgi:type IV pilus assembly protein PilC|nr:type II secretion system F family protein [Atopobiaceae bacterium]